jgi:hypothetical protein
VCNSILLDEPLVGLKYHQSTEGPLRPTSPNGHWAIKLCMFLVCICKCLRLKYGDAVNFMNTLNTFKTFWA